MRAGGDVSTSLGMVEDMNDRCCKEKLRLLSEYRDAATSHSVHVALMAEITGGLLPKVEFDLLSGIASQAYENALKPIGNSTDT